MTDRHTRVKWGRRSDASIQPLTRGRTAFPSLLTSFKPSQSYSRSSAGKSWDLGPYTSGRSVALDHFGHGSFVTITGQPNSFWLIHLRFMDLGLQERSPGIHQTILTTNLLGK